MVPSSASGSAAPPPQASEQGPIDGGALFASGSSNAEEGNSDIENLLGQQKAMRLGRKRLAQDLRNAQKKRKRLKHKVRLLSTEDLLTVVAQLKKKERGSQTELPWPPRAADSCRPHLLGPDLGLKHIDKNI